MISSLICSDCYRIGRPDGFSIQVDFVQEYVFLLRVLLGYALKVPRKNCSLPQVSEADEIGDMSNGELKVFCRPLRSSASAVVVCYNFSRCCMLILYMCGD
jgi:hypothetical protein